MNTSKKYNEVDIKCKNIIRNRRYKLYSDIISHYTYFKYCCIRHEIGKRLAIRPGSQPYEDKLVMRRKNVSFLKIVRKS